MRIGLGVVLFTAGAALPMLPNFGFRKGLVLALVAGLGLVIQGAVELATGKRWSELPPRLRRLVLLGILATVAIGGFVAVTVATQK